MRVILGLVFVAKQGAISLKLAPLVVRPAKKMGSISTSVKVEK